MWRYFIVPCCIESKHGAKRSGVGCSRGHHSIAASQPEVCCAALGTGVDFTASKARQPVYPLPREGLSTFTYMAVRAVPLLPWDLLQSIDGVWPITSVLFDCPYNCFFEGGALYLLELTADGPL